MRCIFPFMLFLMLVPLVAQEAELHNEEEKKKDKSLSFAPIPYLNYSRTGGFGFGAVPMIMYPVNKKDTLSPDSLSGLVGFYTTEGNYAGIFFQRFYLAEDNWRVQAAGGFGSQGFQFIPEIGDIGNDFIEYTTNGKFLLVGFQRRIYKQIYGGINYVFIEVDTEFEVPGFARAEQFNQLMFKLSRDKRSSVYYPETGSLANLTWKTTPEWMGNDTATDKLDLDYNHYWSTNQKQDVIAARALIGIGISDLVFEQKYIVGGEDLRGYTQGEYRGDNLVAVQGEYRWNLWKRMGLVGFAGVASTWTSGVDNDEALFLPSIGAGYRFTAIKKNHFNVGIDAAVGKGDWGVYFRIGEAF